MEFRKKLFDEAKKKDIILNNEQLKLFEKYCRFLQKYNEKVNLTSIIEDNEVIIKHFVDSLTICKHIDKKDSSIIDVGTGAGFPGVVIAIIYKEVSVVLLDSVKKKIKFLEELKKELGINNIKPLWGRDEDIARDEKYREKFDYSTSRAVAELRVLSEYQLPLIKKGGQMLVMKSDIDKELEDAKRALKILGGKVDKIEEFEIEYFDQKLKRTILIINKIKNVDNKYPRRVGIPKKKPL